MGFFNNNKHKEEPPKAAIVNAIASEKNTEPASNPIVEIEKTPIAQPNIIQQSSITNTKIMNETITTISAGTIIEGQMKLEGDLHIEGTIKGTVTSKSKVTLGANGKIEGDVNCQEAEISGKVIGKLNVIDMLFLKGNALIDGDINTGKLVMESGVKFNGKCNMGVKNAGANGAAPANNQAAAQANGVAAKANA
jgi:cytoskeletal protein CcmA (bactofilin family)